MKKLLVTGFSLLCFPLMAQVLQPLGSGLPARVVASYAAGNDYLALFEQPNLSGGDDVFTVARWNGTYWSYYTGGLSIPTEVKNVNGTYNYHSVALYHGEMYVGAYIANATSDASNYIHHLYKWNGNIWESVNNSVSSKNYGIVSMTVFNDQLIVAGRFENTVNGNIVQNIAAFDGTNWKFLDGQPTSQGTDGYINTMVSEGKKLFIGGKFKNFNGDYTGNIAFYTDVNGGWGGMGSPFMGSNAEVLELANFNGGVAALGLNESGIKEIRIFSNGTWSDPLLFDGFTTAEISTIAGAGDYLLIGGQFEKDGNGTSILRYNAGSLDFTGTRITGDFSLGQRGSEAFIWGEFTEQNTGIRNIAKIETNYGAVVGVLFFDKNQDCVQNGLETGIHGKMLRFTDDAGKYWFAITDSMGRFTIALPEGNYNISAFTGRNWINNCSANNAVRVRKGTYSWVNLGQFISLDINDAEVHLLDVTPTSVNPGDEVRLRIIVKNTGSTVLSGPTIQLKHDTRLLNFQSNPKADNYNSNTGEATYTLVDLGMDQVKVIDITLKLPIDAKPSDKYANFLSTGSLFTSNDVYTADNYDTASFALSSNSGSIVKSSDLGEKVNFKVTQIGYKIKFTNTSGSLVNRVVVIDTLDPNAKMLSVNITGYYPDVDPNADISLNYGILTLNFDHANLTSFESNPVSSSGYISYNLVLQNHLQHNDKIYNTATADFDSKWFGHSNTVMVTMFDPNVGVDKIKGNISRAYPNPAKSDFTLEFKTVQSGMLEMVDNAGKVVLSQQVHGISANVNVSSLSAGIYFVRCAGSSAVISINR